MAYLRSQKPPAGGDTYGESPSGVSYVDEAVAVFLASRVEEARIGSEFHSWPDGLPWNKQPWWLWTLWRFYWNGYSDGHAERA